MISRPSGPQDRTQPTKLEIPFGHAFDEHGVSLPESAVRVGGTYARARMSMSQRNLPPPSAPRANSISEDRTSWFDVRMVVRMVAAFSGLIETIFAVHWTMSCLTTKIVAPAEVSDWIFLQGYSSLEQ